ncbi:hypothetical protein Vadar_019022 [Vaccinium darrowii]|uniref:Uncharacterized protein n=1 Tax=Vaccinium darrowii TaxID=229202 RepID=A0ACB7XRK3_9ERIC|nr:hypothetical protein Vadar_019022 [Vaccinium darrowii]
MYHIHVVFQLDAPVFWYLSLDKNVSVAMNKSPTKGVSSGCHTVNKNAIPEFARVVKAKEQLQEFKRTCDGHSYISADLNVKQDGHEQGWRPVPSYDPVVKGAAYHAVKTIQQRSNSLAPYELLEILLAKVKAIENYSKFDMLLKVKRGTKEEKFKVIVNKSVEGKFFVNQMVEDHS